MAALMKAVLRTYRLFNESGDPKTSNFFLMSSPLPVIGIIAFYIYFVKNIGPQWMMNRKPFHIERIMMVYNLMQVVLNSYMFSRAWVLGWGWGYGEKKKWICEPVDYSDNDFANETRLISWMYLMTKILDLIDTMSRGTWCGLGDACWSNVGDGAGISLDFSVDEKHFDVLLYHTATPYSHLTIDSRMRVFFVLRKKDTHISFLHLYHHSMMVLACWIGVKFVAGGHATFLGFINSFVHMVMYSYYFVTSVWPEYKRNIWWKKYITQIQMVQFMAIAVHNLLCLLSMDCNYPKIICALLMPQNCFMLTLFADFYRKAYLKKKSD